MEMPTNAAADVMASERAHVLRHPGIRQVHFVEVQERHGVKRVEVRVRTVRSVVFRPGVEGRGAE